MNGSVHQKGFTLIESVAVGVISSILAGAILSSFYLTNERIKEGTDLIKASQKATFVSYLFRDLARKSYAIVYQDEIFSGAPDTASNLVNSPREVRHFYFIGPPPSFDTLGGFKIEAEDRYLHEWRSGIGNDPWPPVVIGDRDTVFIRPYDRVTQPFTLFPRRKGIEFRVQVMFGSNQLLPLIPERVLCRNQSR